MSAPADVRDIPTNREHLRAVSKKFGLGGAVGPRGRRPQRGGGCGRGICPLPREVRKPNLLLIREG